VRLVEGAGAHTLTDRIDAARSSGDIVAVTVPAGPSALRSRRLRMYSMDDRDQVVRALRDGGWHAFEAPLPSVMVRLVRRWPGTFLDVGANTGVYALLAVTAHPRCRALAFEPVPELADLLRNNVAANPQGRRIHVREIAIGDHSGVAQLHLPPAQQDGTIETSASLDPRFKETIDRIVQVEMSTLDDAWATAGHPPVTVIKVDVEGAEPRVIAGAHDLIATHRPLLAVEVLPRVDAEIYDRLLDDHRYVDVTLNPREAVVNRPRVTPEPLAPNHLLVPWERLQAVVDDLKTIPRLKVTLLD